MFINTTNRPQESEMQVKDMSIGKFQDLIRHTMEQCLDEYFGDPDVNLKLKADVEKRLLASLNKTKIGERGIPAKEAYQKLGIERL